MRAFFLARDRGRQIIAWDEAGRSPAQSQETIRFNDQARDRGRQRLNNNRESLSRAAPAWSLNLADTWGSGVLRTPPPQALFCRALTRAEDLQRFG